MLRKTEMRDNERESLDEDGEYQRLDGSLELAGFWMWGELVEYSCCQKPRQEKQEGSENSFG